jgi:hypothetical protein
VEESIAALLVGLSAVLAALGAAAARRYRDSRLGLVAAAFALFATMGALAFLYAVSPQYGTGFEVEPVPLGLALVAAALLYLAMIRNHPKSPAS